MKFPSKKGGGVSNLPSAMQLVWGMGHCLNEVLRRLFLFAKITSERIICYYSYTDFPTLMIAFRLFQIRMDKKSVYDLHIFQTRFELARGNQKAVNLNKMSADLH